MISKAQRGRQRAYGYHDQSDHLNTPRLVADAAQQTVWRWDQAEPFGSNPADEDPDANSVAFDLPLRLPGQRYDAETGLHYNYFRDYDASLGRYGESDPIGLRGGLNTYAYAKLMPLAAIDPRGLEVLICYRKVRAPFMANHSYFWNTVNSTCCGRVPGEDPLSQCQEAGPPTDYCVPIEGSDGMEGTIFSCCNSRARQGPYFPVTNDCFSTVSYCVENASLQMPPIPSNEPRTGVCPSCALKEEVPYP